MAASDNQTHCRIGRVKFKNGGEVRIMERPVLSGPKQEFVRETRELVEDPRPMTGFVVMVIRDDEATSTGILAPQGFPTRCMPEFVAETVRKVMWGG
jgi:hypothetical protein